MSQTQKLDHSKSARWWTITIVLIALVALGTGGWWVFLKAAAKAPSIADKTAKFVSTAPVDFE